jgi:PAT family beta-lactamase induction signal transducer AmpG
MGHSLAESPRLMSTPPGPSGRLGWLYAAPVVWATSTYFAEGLPYSLVHQVVGQQYLTAAGFSAEVVGLASLLHAPWLFKFVWSPLVERRASTKSWMVGAQLALAVVCVALGTSMRSGSSLGLLLALLIGAAFVAATNDIAIDGYYLRSLDSQKQTSLSGVRIGAFRAAMLLGSGPIVSFAGVWGFGAAMYVLAGILALLAATHALLLPRDSASDPVGAPGAGSVVRTSGDAARAFLRQPLIVASVVLLLTYRAGDALLFAMNAKFLSSLGLDTTLRGVVNGTFGTAASITGSIVGGLLLSRFGFRRMFVPITLVQSGALLLYHLLAGSGAHLSERPTVALAGVEVSSLALVSGTVVAEQFIAGVGTAAFTSFILRLCSGSYKTMHFAFASSVMSVAGMVAGAASGYVYEGVGSGSFFLVAFAASLPGVAASFFVRQR